METVVKEDEKEPKLSQNENDYTEQYKGLIMLRKGKLEENEVWFATVGQMLISDGDGKKIMENAEDNKKRKLTKLLILAGIIAATLGGCVISLNIQKNNNNSDQKVDQNASANQENDSTNFNFKINEK